MSGVPTNYQNSVHAVGATVAWTVLLNISIVCGALRYDKAAALAHALFGWIILILTFIAVLSLLAPYGFIAAPGPNNNFTNFTYAHGIIGCMLLGFVVIQVAGGVVARLCQTNKSLDILKLKPIRDVHRYFGFFLALLYKINILWSYYGNYPATWVLLAWEVGWLIAYLAIKFPRTTIQAKIISPDVIGYQCPKIQRMEDVAKVTNNYIIFADYVYDAKELEETHPGGHKVIRLMKGRQVDRFIYGMYSAELFPELPPHAHSSFALQLVGKPIARLVTPPTYLGLRGQIIEADIKYVTCISTKTQIYSLGVVPKFDKIRYNGYTDIRQFGQYYSFTIVKKITRIYTAVNFLNARNIEMMNQILQVKRDSSMKRALLKKAHVETELPKLMVEDNQAALKQQLRQDKEEVEMDSYIPVMMKVYSTGKLTKGLKSVDFVNTPVQISIPRGRGVDLENTPPGRIIIVAGGTGLFPFSDLIDLLYKSQLIAEGHPRSNDLIRHDPVLQFQPFAKFFFVFLIAINQPQDIHPITYSQLVSLSQHQKRVKVVMRVSKNGERLQSGSRNIQFTREYFNKRVLSQSSLKEFSRVWICGPPKLNTDTANILLENGYTQQQFLLI